MRKIIFAFAFCALFLTGPLWSQDKTKTSYFNEQFLKTVVSVEQMDTATNAHPIGTGFLIGMTNAHIILITAQHVVTNESGRVKENLAFRLNTKSTNSQLVPDAQMAILGGEWFLSTNSDLACRILSSSPQEDFKTLPLSLFLSKKYVQATAPVVILGFPMGLRSDKYATPIARHDIVASPVEDNIIIDGFVFPGNSGGPVFYAPTIKLGANLSSDLINDEQLIGVAVDYITYTDVALSVQTRRPRITFEENSGLTLVVPSDKILDMLHSARFKAQDGKILQP